ncbi:MAG: MFS transporter [Actinomycetota bacterium]
MNTSHPARLSAAYWRLWTASAISNVGDGVLIAALPLLAVRTTHSRLSVGLISTFFAIPWLLFALPVGAVIDRVDRRKVLVVADSARAALIGIVALIAAVSSIHIWMLWVLAFGLGLGEVFFDSTSQTILPSIVPPAQLERANGLRYAAELTGNTFVGAPIGSVLFAIAVWLPFGVDAASFVVAAMLAASLRGSFRATGAAPHDSTSVMVPTWRDDIKMGFRWMWRRPLLRNLAIAIALNNLAFAATESTLVLFATEELGVSQKAFGLLIAIIGAGSIAAGVLGSWLVKKVGRRFAILVAASTPVLTMLSIGIVPITWWVVAMTTVQAVMITIWSIVAVSLRQQIVPDHLFGRVNAVYRWFSWGAMPIGALLGGLIAQRWGLRAPYFFGAGVVFLAYLLVIARVTERAITDALPATVSSTANAVSADDHTPTHLERDPLDDLL